MRRMEPQRPVSIPEIKAPDIEVHMPDVHLPDFPNPMPTTVQKVTIDKRLVVLLYVQLTLLNLAVFAGVGFFVWSLLQ